MVFLIAQLSVPPHVASEASKMQVIGLTMSLLHCCLDRINKMRRTSATHQSSPSTDASEKSKSQLILLGLSGENMKCK